MSLGTCVIRVAKHYNFVFHTNTQLDRIVNEVKGRIVEDCGLFRAIRNRLCTLRWASCSCSWLSQVDQGYRRVGTDEKSMSRNSNQFQPQLAKAQSRGISCDMTPEAIVRRLEIVDELRELARELQNAKRLDPVNLDSPKAVPSAPNIAVPTNV